MPASNSYCAFVADKPLDEVNRYYHDHDYGFPIESDDELFGRLILEINQAGLSWHTILVKQDNFRKAYSTFSINKVAAYKEKQRQRLLNDCLLYTSPSPRDQRGSRMPSSA